MFYFKIQSLYKRDPQTKKFLNELSCEEFENIKWWHVEEKIDGMNINIHYDHELKKVYFGGRTENANIPAGLANYLNETFTAERFSEFEGDAILFGEGIGNKIQSSLYGPEFRFILFDAKIGKWWLTRQGIKDIASQLRIEHAPTISEKEDFTGFTFIWLDHRKSGLKGGENTPIEGIVCRPVGDFLFRDGKPIIFKLKVKDFS